MFIELDFVRIIGVFTILVLISFIFSLICHIFFMFMRHLIVWASRQPEGCRLNKEMCYYYLLLALILVFLLIFKHFDDTPKLSVIEIDFVRLFCAFTILVFIFFIFSLICHIFFILMRYLIIWARQLNKEKRYYLLLALIFAIFFNYYSFLILLKPLL